MSIHHRTLLAYLAFLVAFALTPAASARDVKTVRVSDTGFVADLHYVSGAHDQTAIIMLNGSDGGIPSAQDARDLAQSGYTVLSLAYFQNWNQQPDGVPSALRNIPLEYFYRAIEWLKVQPQVNGRKVVLMGQSRGAELALLLGSRRSDIAGVIAFSPSSYVWHAVGSPGVPAWTENDQPVSFRVSATDTSLSPYDLFVKAPASDAARIQVENIRGPVLLLSSRTDGVWPASTYADEISARMRKCRREVQNIQFDDASHLLMGTGPGITSFEIPGTNMNFDFGGSTEGNARARAKAWKAVKQYLAQLPSR